MEAKRRTCFRKNGVVSCVLCLSEVTVSRSDDWFWEMDFTGHFIRHGLKALVVTQASWEWIDEREGGDSYYRILQ